MEGARRTHGGLEASQAIEQTPGIRIANSHHRISNCAGGGKVHLECVVPGNLRGTGIGAVDEQSIRVTHCPVVIDDDDIRVADPCHNRSCAAIDSAANTDFAIVRAGGLKNNVVRSHAPAEDIQSRAHTDGRMQNQQVRGIAVSGRRSALVKQRLHAPASRRVPARTASVVHKRSQFKGIDVGCSRAHRSIQRLGIRVVQVLSRQIESEDIQAVHAIDKNRGTRINRDCHLLHAAVGRPTRIDVHTQHSEGVSLVNRGVILVTDQIDRAVSGIQTSAFDGTQNGGIWRVSGRNRHVWGRGLVGPDAEAFRAAHAQLITGRESVCSKSVEGREIAVDRDGELRMRGDKQIVCDTGWAAARFIAPVHDQTWSDHRTSTVDKRCGIQGYWNQRSGGDITTCNLVGGRGEAAHVRVGCRRAIEGQSLESVAGSGTNRQHSGGQSEIEDIEAGELGHGIDQAVLAESLNHGTISSDCRTISIEQQTAYRRDAVDQQVYPVAPPCPARKISSQTVRWDDGTGKCWIWVAIKKHKGGT